MDENIRTSLEDAQWHLDMARNADDEDAPARIVVSYCVLSLIRAADALCWHYTGNRCRSGRGHDLHNEFEDLYTHNDLPESFATYKERLRKWVKQEKSEAHHTVPQGTVFEPTSRRSW